MEHTSKKGAKTAADDAAREANLAGKSGSADRRTAGGDDAAKQSIGDMTVREFFSKVGHVAGNAGFLVPAIVIGIMVAIVVGSYVPLTFEPTDASASESTSTPDLSTVDAGEETTSDSGDTDTSDLGIDTSNLQDGTYTGSGTGFTGTITVQVTVSGGKISDIQIVSSEDSGQWFENAKGVIQEVLDAQSTNVDVVSGATYSSRGILQAIRNALAQASGGETEALTTPASSSSSSGSSNGSAGNISVASVDTSNLKDGTYTGTGLGFEDGRTVMSVTVSGGRITGISNVSNEDQPVGRDYFGDALSGIVPQVLAKQSTDVDAVTGATYSSRGILQGIAAALQKAQGTSGGGNGGGQAIATAADKGGLEKEIAKYAQLSQADYTTDSWKAYEQAYGAAVYVDASGDATQAQVDAALSALQAAWRSLQRVAEPEPSGEAGYADGEYVGYALCGERGEDGSVSHDTDFEPYYVAVRVTVTDGVPQDVQQVDPWEEGAPVRGTSSAREGDEELAGYDEGNDDYLDLAIMGRTRRGTTYRSVVAQVVDYVREHGTAPTLDLVDQPSGIDSVSGATYSSRAIVGAYRDALQQAAEAYVNAQAEDVGSTGEATGV